MILENRKNKYRNKNEKMGVKWLIKLEFSEENKNGKGKETNIYAIWFFFAEFAACVSTDIFIW